MRVSGLRRLVVLGQSAESFKFFLLALVDFGLYLAIQHHFKLDRLERMADRGGGSTIGGISGRTFGTTALGGASVSMAELLSERFTEARRLPPYIHQVLVWTDLVSRKLLKD